MQDHRTYTLVFSVDVRGGTTERMLTDSTLYSMNSTQTYAQKCQTYSTLLYAHLVIPERIRQPLDHCVKVLDVR
jgi:hypothetical protein